MQNNTSVQHFHFTHNQNWLSVTREQLWWTFLQDLCNVTLHPRPKTDDNFCISTTSGELRTQKHSKKIMHFYNTT